MTEFPLEEKTQTEPPVNPASASRVVEKESDNSEDEYDDYIEELGVGKKKVIASLSNLIRTVEIMREEELSKAAGEEIGRKLEIFLNNPIIVKTAELELNESGTLPDNIVNILSEVVALEDWILRDQIVAERLRAISERNGSASPKKTVDRTDNYLESLKQNRDTIKKFLPKNFHPEASGLKSQGISRRPFYRLTTIAEVRPLNSHIGANVERTRRNVDPASPIINEMKPDDTSDMVYLLEDLLNDEEIADIESRTRLYLEARLDTVFDLQKFAELLNKRGITREEINSIASRYADAYSADELCDLEELLVAMYEIDEDSGDGKFIRKGRIDYRGRNVSPNELIGDKASEQSGTWGMDLYDTLGSFEEILTETGMEVLDAAMEAPFNEIKREYCKVLKEVLPFRKRYGSSGPARPLIWIQTLENFAEITSKARKLARKGMKSLRERGESPRYSDIYERVLPEVREMLDGLFLLPFEEKKSESEIENYKEILLYASNSLLDFDYESFEDAHEFLKAEIEGRLLTDIRRIGRRGVSDSPSPYEESVKAEIDKLAKEGESLTPLDIKLVRENIQKRLEPLLYPPVIRSLKSVPSYGIEAGVEKARDSFTEKKRGLLGIRKKVVEHSYSPSQLMEMVLDSPCFQKREGIRREAKRFLDENGSDYKDQLSLSLAVIEHLENYISNGPLVRIVDRLESYDKKSEIPVVNELDVEILESIGTSEPRRPGDKMPVQSNLSLLVEVSGYNAYAAEITEEKAKSFGDGSVDEHLDRLYQEMKDGLLKSNEEKVNSVLTTIAYGLKKEKMEMSDFRNSLSYLQDIGLIERVPMKKKLPDVERMKDGGGVDEFFYEDLLYELDDLKSRGLSEEEIDGRSGELLLIEHTELYRNFRNPQEKYGGKSPQEAIDKMNASLSPYVTALTDDERIEDVCYSSTDPDSEFSKRASSRVKRLLGASVGIK